MIMLLKNKAWPSLRRQALDWRTRLRKGIMDLAGWLAYWLGPKDQG